MFGWNGNKEKVMNERMEKIANKVAHKRTADYGDTQAYFNISEFFTDADGNRQLRQESVDIAKEFLSSAIMENYSAMHRLLKRTLNKNKRELEEAGLSLK